MAGNRVHKIGSVFSRTRNLLRVGVVPRPLWFDVYGAFPPLREPVFRTPRPRYGRVTDVVRPILYPEDSVRAKFYSVYGSGPRPFDLSQPNFKSTCQRFVEKFNELKEEGSIEEDRLFEETGKALLAQGIILQRRGTEKVAQPARQDSDAFRAQLQTVLEEMQGMREGQREQPAEPPAEPPETRREDPAPS
ncbi:small ribosomal subunit protein mS23 [Eudromia elegans]